jgi:hypothetical protein
MAGLKREPSIIIKEEPKEEEKEIPMVSIEYT